MLDKEKVCCTILLYLLLIWIVRFLVFERFLFSILEPGGLNLEVLEREYPNFYVFQHMSLPPPPPPPADVASGWGGLR